MGYAPGVCWDSLGGYPKMNGENHGSKPYEQMDDFWGFSKTTPIFGVPPKLVTGVISPLYITGAMGPLLFFGLTL